MKNQILQYLRDKQLKSAIPEELILSYDKPLNDDKDDPVNLLDFIEADTDIEAEATSRIDYQEFRRKQSKNNQQILDDFEHGFSSREIAKRRNCSSTYINYVRKTLRDRYHKTQTTYSM